MTEAQGDRPYGPLSPIDLRSQVSLGTMTFGGQVAEPEAHRMLDAALEAGVTLFDTANVYQGGRSEEILGRWLAKKRGRVLVASKVGSPKRGGGPQLRPTNMRAELEGSLRRLGVDQLDLYYLHRPDRDTPLEDSLATLQEFIDEGLVRQGAASNFGAWHFSQMHAIAAANGWDPVRVSQPMYNLLARRLEDEYSEASSALSLLNIVYNPLAGGLLTGKHVLEGGPPPETRFATAGYGRLYTDRYWNAEQFRAVEALRAVADGAGLTLLELAFRWLISRPEVTSILIGATTPGQLDANLAACAGGPLSDDVLEACDAVRPLTHGVAPSHVK